jgi:hypothetical protein
MTTKVRNVVVDAVDTGALGRFWSALLQQPITGHDANEVMITLCAGAELVFTPATRPKRGKNRVHFDLASTSIDHQSRLVEWAQRLGAAPRDIGQGTAPWVVLADPDGNEFCVLEPRDEYLGVGPMAAVVIDALNPPALAQFWSHATSLPVTREHPEYASLGQDSCFWLEFVRTEEPKTEKNRISIEVAPAPDGHPTTEVARLLAQGAMRANSAQGDVESVLLYDPEGNEFCVAQC